MMPLSHHLKLSKNSGSFPIILLLSIVLTVIFGCNKPTANPSTSKESHPRTPPPVTQSDEHLKAPNNLSQEEVAPPSNNQSELPELLIDFTAEELGTLYHEPKKFHVSTRLPGDLKKYQSDDYPIYARVETRPEKINVRGTIRRVWKHRTLPGCNEDIFYGEDETHVVELWSNAVHFPNELEDVPILPIYCLFSSENWLNNIKPGMQIVVRGISSGYRRGNNDVRIHDCKILSQDSQQETVGAISDDWSLEEALARRTSFNEAVERLQDDSVIGLYSDDFRLALNNRSLDETGKLNPEIIDESLQLEGIYAITIPKEISASGIQQIVELKTIKEIEIELPLKNCEAEDLKILGTLPIQVVRFVNDGRLTDDILEAISGISTINELIISGNANISNEGLAAIGHLTKLQTLRVDGQDITDEGLEHFSSLHHLRDVYVGGPRVSGAGLTHLENAKNIFRLSLWAPLATPESLKSISLFPSLTSLEILSHTTFRGDPGRPKIGTGEFLQNLEKLQFLQLDRVDNLQPDLASSLAKANNFRAISIVESIVLVGAFSNAHFETLGFARVENAELVNEEAIQLATAAPNLKTLNLNSNPITDEAISELAGILKDLENLEVSETMVSPKCLPSLVKLEKMEEIRVSESFSENDIEALKMEHPNHPQVYY